MGCGVKTAGALLACRFAAPVESGVRPNPTATHDGQIDAEGEAVLRGWRAETLQAAASVTETGASMRFHTQAPRLKASMSSS